MKFISVSSLCLITLCSLSEASLESEEPLCTNKGGECQDSNDCCDAFTCSGTASFKTCVEPPVCLEDQFDCSNGTPCCAGQCVMNDATDIFECTSDISSGQRLGGASSDRDVGLRRRLQGPNLLTTRVPGEPFTTSIGCSTGDPHILSFDGLKYDCHGEGEFVLVKSNYTAREVQVRYEHMSVNRALSVGKAVAIRDEGDVPVVQISIAALNSSLGYDMLDNDGCGKVQLFIDGVQRDLSSGSGQDDKVQVIHQHKDVWVKYPQSGMSVKVRYHRCRLNVCVTLPDTDSTVIGLLGTPSGQVEDDWTTPSGSQLQVPTSIADRLTKPAYDFCTQNFCLQENSRSLFTYNEVGLDFDYYSKCLLPFDSTVEEYVGTTPQWITDICQGDIQCVIDMHNGDVTDQEVVRQTLTGYSSICNPRGGECDESSCCDSQCIDYGGLAGKVCSDELTCAPEFGSCEDSACCESLTCTELDNGSSLCLEQRECMDEWMSCGDEDCCEGMVCLPNRFGNNQCRRLHQCSEKYDDCSMVGCCGTMKCLESEVGWKHCDDVPDCWEVENKDCTHVPCCNGLTCVSNDDGLNLCKHVPDFVDRFESCQNVPCNENSDIPLECVSVVDELEREDMQCRYTSAIARVLVFNDVNSNGIKEDGEPGLAGIPLRLIHDGTTNTVERTVEVMTDANGYAEFSEVPRGVPLRCQAIDSPKGSIRTIHNKGSDDSIDSDLLDDGTTSPFVVTEDVWTNTALGYRMPADLEIQVFNDVNRNGIFDPTEVGIQGVGVRLIRASDSTNIFDRNDNGTAHEELFTDANGLVVFTKVPQSLGIRAKVTQPPAGAIPTKGNVGSNEAVDSDLRSDGTSYGFKLKGGGVHNFIDLGFCMPESVTVRVWDDTNANGVLDNGELPIEDVMLRLVDASTRLNLTDYANGGNSHAELRTDEQGLVTFTKVPLNRKIRVKVTEGSLVGSVPTQKYLRSGPKILSDLQYGDISKSFVVSNSGTQIDLGYNLPGSMTVRVWEDADRNGILDGNERGIQGVHLRLVSDGTLENLAEFMGGGNAHSELSTNEDGYVTFTEVPRGLPLRVKVTNAPQGALRTLHNAGDNPEKDSDLGENGLSDSFVLSKDGMTEISLGYQLPHTVIVRVWNDENKNGLQDAGEVGVPGARLRIVNENDSSFYEGQCEASNSTDLFKRKGLCNEELTSDNDGLVEFTAVPRGKFRVKVLNKPVNVRRTTQNRGSSESHDSDFGDDGLSDVFNLASFDGPVFSDIGLGYILPQQVVVRVWDDINSNGIQDPHEIGIEGVGLRLITAAGEYVEGFGEISTNAIGNAAFESVPTTEHFRVKVTNAPPGAARTALNAHNDTVDSDLRRDGTTVSFYLGSFGGDVFDKIDIGYLLPKDVQVKVWNDLNANGIQDEGEEGVPGVSCRLIDSNSKQGLSNIGAGSTAHLELTTNETGFVTFKKAPKSLVLRVELLNTKGAIPTAQNRGSNDELDSDLGIDLISDEFNLYSFVGGNVYGSIDLGLQMPKKVIVRVWNDTNLNGIQDDDELGIPGVSLQLIESQSRKFLVDHGGSGNSHQVATTDEFGRAVFDGVPMGQRYRVKVIQKPEDGIVTWRNAGNDDQLDSDLSSSGISDSFKLPTGVVPLYDSLDIGYYFPSSVRTYVEQHVTFEAPGSVQGLEDEAIPLNLTVDVPSALEGVVGPVNSYVEINTAMYPYLVISANGESQNIVVDGWTRVSTALVDSVQIEADHDYSGEFVLPMRLAVSGALRSKPVDFASTPLNVTVKFLPVADAIELPSPLFAVEDDGIIPLGANIASLGRAIVSDLGERRENNMDRETVFEIEFTVPADSENLTYTLSGDNLPSAIGTTNGNGSAVVSYIEDGEGARIFTITSSLLDQLNSTSQLTREQGEADILDTIGSFKVTFGPEHTDLDGDIMVKISNVDVNLGVADIRETSFNPLVIQAVADMPGVQVSRSTRVGVEDDGELIPLHIVAIPSDDQDGSETISVKVTAPSDNIGPIGNITTPNLPTGISLVNLGEGAYLCTSSTGLAALNEFLNGTVAFLPRQHLSGRFEGAEGVRVDVIATESATGVQVKTKTATATDYIDIVVAPVLDGTTVSIKGNAVGREDTVIPVPLSVTVGDPDGSETYQMFIESTNLPVGTRLYGAYEELFPSNNEGQYVLSPMDIADLSLLPPLHYSSALPSQGDITLLTTTETRETGLTDVTSLSLEIPIRVIGVADKPEKLNIQVTGLEDESYDIGAAVTELGPISDILVDRDGSETLSLILDQLPKGVVPQSLVPDGISFLGNGKYQVSQSAIESLSLPPRPQYSGDNPYPDVRMRATSQEIDGNQRNSNWWSIDFAIEPVVDGFGTAWTSKVWVSEGTNEAAEDVISMASIQYKRLIDSDSSESVLEYVLDFSNFIQEAGIGQHIVKNLSITTLKELVDNYLTGEFEFNEIEGAVTVKSDDIAGIALRPQLFLDSNQDFSIPVKALVEDKAIIHGQEIIRTEFNPGTFQVHISGTADVPTVFATSTTGTAHNLVPLSVGGETTDTDEDLGRTKSETVYYVMQYLNPGPNRTRWALMDGGGQIVGYNQGDYHWMLESRDLTNLHLLALTSGNESQTLEFKFTSIAIENDGDMATNSTLFNVVVTRGTGVGTGPTPPLTPIVEVGNHNGTEDRAAPLDVNARADPQDISNPSVSCTLSGVPQGASIVGALLNPITGKFVVKAEDVDAGRVLVTPPRDFSGSMPIVVEAVATNRWALTATTGEIPVTFEIDPVADGARISISASPLREDEEVTASVSISEIDIDGSEQIGDFAYLQIANIASLRGGYDLVHGSNTDAILHGGKSVVGYYRIPTDELSSLILEPLEHWHGDISINVVTTVVEPLDDPDGDHMRVSTGSRSFTIIPVADPPIVTVPSDPIVANEDEWILIGDQLDVQIVDTVTTNGAEQLSLVLSGLPTDTLLSDGANNGDGSWAIPVASLDTLRLLPPENYNGDMALTLTGITVELSNGYSEAVRSEDFMVTVSPIADSFLMVAENPSLNGTSVNLELNIRMLGLRNDTLSPERLSLAFAGIPEGLRLWATRGGRVEQVDVDAFNFTGTPLQANSLQLVRSGPEFNEPTNEETSEHVVIIQGVTSDGGNILDPAVFDDFVLYSRPNQDFVPGVEELGSNVTGTEGNDILVGTNGADVLDGAAGDDIIRGGLGNDTLTGDAGRDIFEWQLDDIVDSVDVITDFAVGLDGDILDFSVLVPVMNTAPEGWIAQYVQLQENNDSTLVLIDVTGSASDFQGLVELSGVTDLDLTTLVSEGNILI